MDWQTRILVGASSVSVYLLTYCSRTLLLTLCLCFLVWMVNYIKLYIDATVYSGRWKILPRIMYTNSYNLMFSYDVVVTVLAWTDHSLNCDRIVNCLLSSLTQRDAKLNARISSVVIIYNPHLECRMVIRKWFDSARNQFHSWIPCPDAEGKAFFAYKFTNTLSVPFCSVIPFSWNMN